MKSFLTILFIICGLCAALYFLYAPNIEPRLSRSPIHQSEPSRIISEPEKKERSPSKFSPSKVTRPVPKTASTSSGGIPVKNQAPPKSELDQLLEKKYPMPQILPLMEIVQNWKAVPPNAYPAKIVVNESLAFDLLVNGRKIGSSNVAPGALVKPVRLLGDQLTVANLANPSMVTRVAVDKTDFKKRIEKRYNDFVKLKTEQTLSRRAVAKKIIQAKDSMLAMLRKGARFDDSGDPRFAAVKASIRAGDCPTVTIEEAKSYTWNGSDKIGGLFAGTYDTATVHFDVKTIFGVFPIDCKALLKGGRVIAWIDPITEEKI